ncbi:unnamed protein product [Pleuronectes platessa]|uniref:Uncharacterized protein n=1 Tax=Pleuronectes platessa TaxID=8262 RepID=A0A9N7YQQ9_PLEPL|nr:unnamed protein product [Pleuronectes platessa]
MKDTGPRYLWAFLAQGGIVGPESLTPPTEQSHGRVSETEYRMRIQTRQREMERTQQARLSGTQKNHLSTQRLTYVCNPPWNLGSEFGLPPLVPYEPDGALNESPTNQQLLPPIHLHPLIHLTSETCNRIRGTVPTASTGLMVAVAFVLSVGGAAPPVSTLQGP